MKEPMVGSFLYGDHKVPKKSRPWQESLKLPMAVLGVEEGVGTNRAAG